MPYSRRIVNGICLLLLCLLLLCSCARLNSIHRDLDVTQGKGALIDIKQRAIIVSKTDERVIVCAEPSPESLSSYAAELAAEADLPEEITARLASAFQEGSAFVGLRTPSIQLLRDSMYRLCEGYMNGVLDRAQYVILMKRYQKYMVALLAIEQLTGSLRPPTVAINTAGSATVAGSVSDLRKELDYIDANIKQLEEDIKTAETDDKKDIQSKIDGLKKDRAAVSDALKTAQRTASKGSTNVTISSVGTPSSRSDAEIQAVSQVVNDIVMAIIKTEDTGQLCFLYLLNDNANENPELKRACAEYIQNKNDLNRLKLRQAQAMLDAAVKKGKLTNQESESILRVLNSIQ